MEAEDGAHGEAGVGDRAARAPAHAADPAQDTPSSRGDAAGRPAHGDRGEVIRAGRIAPTRRVSQLTACSYAARAGEPCGSSGPGSGSTKNRALSPELNCH